MLSSILENAFQLPVALLRPFENLPSLFGEVRLSAVAGNVLEEDGLKGCAVLLALSSLFSLGLFELELDVGGLGELFRVDGVGDSGPEVQGLVGGLLLVGWEEFRRHVEGGDVDDDMLVFDRDVALKRVSVKLSG